MTPWSRAGTLRAIARPSGALSMVAMDQRESLRAMHERALGHPVGDETLAAFKIAVAETLSPAASAMLLDHDTGSAAMTRLAAGCALIVAADALHAGAGGSTDDTSIDERVDAARERDGGARALKLLVVWKRDGERERRLAMTRTFVARCHAAGLLAIVEGVVRVPEETLLLEAARQLSGCGPDLYKAEVPLFAKAEPAELARRCERLSSAIARPWVVLSAGVALADYERGVEAACRSGASGFLAGRAIWSDAVGDRDVRARLAAVSLPRLRRLGELVDRLARPVPA